MSEKDWTDHFMNMAFGKAGKKQMYYTLNQITPAQQALEMAKDQVNVIKAQKSRKSSPKVKRVSKTSGKKQKRKTKQKKSLVLRKGVKPNFFS